MSGSRSEAEETEQFIVFSVGDETYGLPIGSVDEIVRCPEKLTRVPRAPAFVSRSHKSARKGDSHHRSAPKVLRPRAG